MTARDQDRILIAGAGPVGLVAALRLALAQIPVTLIEADTTPPVDLRASTFHPPTLDMLDTIDLAEPLIARGLISPTWQIRLHETHEKAEFDLSLITADTRHPYRLQCEQAQLCSLIRARISIMDQVDYRPGMRLINATQSEDGVSANFESAAGPVALSGRFLIGADGARSVVRGLLGLDFEGQTYPETTILATTIIDFTQYLPGLSNVNYVWAGHGTFSLLRLPGLWRCSLYPLAGETIEDAIKPAAVEAKLQKIVPLDQPYPVGDMRPYRVHQRIVETYQKGRIFLAGDAAHLNSPSGGMGMNGGIHDAFLLTDLLIRAWPGDDIGTLQSYTATRRPIALDEILAQADRNRARMQERDGDKRRAMLSELQRIAGDPELARLHLLRTSMIDGLRRAGQSF